eukprot:10977348-Alexandrium_andersonii.AAC.1
MGSGEPDEAPPNAGPIAKLLYTLPPQGRDRCGICARVLDGDFVSDVGLRTYCPPCVAAAELLETVARLSPLWGEPQTHAAAGLVASVR